MHNNVATYSVNYNGREGADPSSSDGCLEGLFGFALLLVLVLCCAGSVWSGFKEPEPDPNDPDQVLDPRD